MKKVYMLFAMLLIAGVTLAQINPRMNQGLSLKSSKTLKVQPGTSFKSIIDTAGWTDGFVPQFCSPTAAVYIWGMTEGTPAAHIGYWFGTSGDAVADSAEADQWAQCWVNTANVYVKGILFFADGKAVVVGGASSTLTVGVQNMSEATGCIVDATTTPYTFGPAPSAVNLASGTMNVTAVDTNFLSFNYVDFATMANVTADFCAVIDFKGIRVNGDTCYMMCDEGGDGLGLAYSQYCMDPTAYYWVALKVIDAALDANMSIFAVIDNGGGIEDEGYFQGMKMSIRNNPAKENTYVDYMLQYTSSVKLHVYDMTGKEVVVINEGKQAAGVLNSINVNTCDLKSGNYFVSLEANGGRFTKKLVVD